MTQRKPLAVQIKSLNNQIKRLMERNAISGNDANLTGVQYAILGFLSQQPDDADVFQRDVEAEFNIRRSTATGILQPLEKGGYIKRVAVAGDARLKKIIRTEKAMEVDKIARGKVDEMQVRLMRGITPDEMEQFYTVLDKIAENAEG